MAQKQHTNYQEDILSFDLRQAMLGILNPGRYCGYDTFSPASEGGGVISISIRHTATGIRLASKVNPPVLGLQHGVVMTPQGLIIQEDNANIPITIDDGSTNGGLVRYDVIYLSHIFLDGVPGDNPATYDIVKGTPGAGTPAVPHPSYEVPLVLVTIPDGAISWTELTFEPFPCPNLGDFNISDLIDPLIAQVAADHIILEGLNSRVLDDPDWPSPALSDNTNYNVSTLAHGFMPKLPGAQSIPHFFDSGGRWINPGGIWNSVPSMPVPLVSNTSPNNTSRYINVETYLGVTGISHVLLEVSWNRDGITSSTAWGYIELSPTENAYDRMFCPMLCQPQLMGLPDGNQGSYFQVFQGIVKVNNGQIYLKFTSLLGTADEWNASRLTNLFGIRVIAYQKLPGLLA